MQPLSDFTSASSRPTSSISENRRLPSCSPKIAAERARLLFGQFRKGDAADPNVWVAAVVALFTGYPESVVRRVTDPRIGLGSAAPFFPSLFDVRHACEAEMKPIYDEIRRAENLRGNAFLLSAPVQTTEQRSAALARMREKFPDMFPAAVADPDAARRAAESDLDRLYRERDRPIDASKDFRSRPGAPERQPG